jgi:hypothetical protein
MAASPWVRLLQPRVNEGEGLAPKSRPPSAECPHAAWECASARADLPLSGPSPAMAADETAAGHVSE